MKQKTLSVNGYSLTKMVVFIIVPWIYESDVTAVLPESMKNLYIRLEVLIFRFLGMPEYLLKKLQKKSDTNHF